MNDIKNYNFPAHPFLDEITESINHILNYESSIYKRFIIEQLTNLYKRNVRFIQLLSDVLRLVIINKYSGIYVDCDTFPIKPFDDKLL